MLSLLPEISHAVRERTVWWRLEFKHWTSQTPARQALAKPRNYSAHTALYFHNYAIRPFPAADLSEKARRACVMDSKNSAACGCISLPAFYSQRAVPHCLTQERLFPKLLPLIPLYRPLSVVILVQSSNVWQEYLCVSSSLSLLGNGTLPTFPVPSVNGRI